MNFNTFDLNLLRAFSALMHEGNLTTAGASLGLTQPAMSRAIQRLRVHFDDPLFVRTTHGMQPTEYARRLAGPIEDALNSVRNALDLRAAFAPSTSTRSFRIVMTDSASAFYLPRLVSELKRTAPGIGLVAVQMPRERYREALESATVDLALGQLPPDLGSLHRQHLWDEALVCLLRKDHPTLGEELTMQQFMACEQICVTAPARSDELIRRALGKQAAQRRIALSLPYYLVVPMILAECDMIAVMPQTICEPFIRKWRLKMLPLPFRVPPMNMGQMWHERLHHDAGHRWLRGKISEMFAQRNPAAAE